MVLECGGNGRSFFTPQARGNQWTNGGAGCAEWTGVRLADVLKAAGVKPSAVFTGHYGADPHLSGDAKQATRCRAACRSRRRWTEQPDRVGDERQAAAEHPRRAGASDHSGLAGLGVAQVVDPHLVRDKEHDGQGMGARPTASPSSRWCRAARPTDGNFKILESMPVRSIITNPANGAKLAGRHQGAEAARRGLGRRSHRRAASTSRPTSARPGQRAKLDSRRTTTTGSAGRRRVKLPSDGYYEMWARATDSKGEMQPHIAGNWNPQGYGGNPMHRIAVLVG